MICKIVGLFVNTLTADDKYSLLNNHNLTQPIQMQLSQKQKTFSQLFFAFLKSMLNFAHFQNKMSLIAEVFSKLRTPICSQNIYPIVRNLNFHFSYPYMLERSPDYLLLIVSTTVVQQNLNCLSGNLLGITNNCASQKPKTVFFVVLRHDFKWRQ